MSSLLESILENSQPEIVSEQHNINAINWVAGLTDPGEMISCGYLPEIRRRENENDTEYALRITPIVLALPQEQQAKIMGAAIARCGLDTSNGRVSLMVAGEALKDWWHKVGVGVRHAVNSQHCQQLSNQGFIVLKTPAVYLHNGVQRTSEETFLLIRDDTGFELGSVGRLYKPIQNSERYEVLDTVLRDYGARYETAGVVDHGRRVWIQAKLPKELKVQPGDEVSGYATFFGDNSGFGAEWLYPTTKRAVCNNTLRIANQDRFKGLRIKHTGDVRGKIEECKRLLGIATKEFDKFGEVAVQAVHTPLAVEPFIHGVLDSVLEVTEAQAKLGVQGILDTILKVDEANREVAAKKVQNQLKRRENVLQEILTAHDSNLCQPHGSAWGLLNSVTQVADHGKALRRFQGEGKDERRLESILNGELDDIKQVAYEKVLASVSRN